MTNYPPFKAETEVVGMHKKRGRSYHLLEEFGMSFCEHSADALRVVEIEIWDERDRARFEGSICQRCKRERARRERALEGAK